MAALAALLLFSAAGCKRAGITKHEYMYVSAPETSLRDRVATLYTKVGTLRNGERVEVVEKQKRFLKVRTSAGVEGWVEQRSLVSQEVFDGFQKLAQDNTSQPPQAHGATRFELNMHLTPSRDGEHLYQLKEGEKLEILRRATTDKNAPKPPPASPARNSNNSSSKAQAGTSAAKQEASPPTPATTPPSTQDKTSQPPAAAAKTAGSPSGASAPPAEKTPPTPVMEDWYLVRDSSGHVGWVLLRMIDLDVPLEIARYAEGKRIVGYFVLNTVPEEDQQIPQYLVLLNDPKDGLPWDYNQVQVFTRNRTKHHYVTAYRDKDFEGYLPVKVGHQVFEKEGDLPTFTLRKKNDKGQIVDVSYKLNGPIVKRLLSPEEEAEQKAKREAALAERQKAASEARAKRAAAHPQAAASKKTKSKHKHK